MNLTDLPNELIYHIISYLLPKDIAQFRQIPYFQEITDDYIKRNNLQADIILHDVRLFKKEFMNYYSDISILFDIALEKGCSTDVAHFLLKHNFPSQLSKYRSGLNTGHNYLSIEKRQFITNIIKKHDVCLLDLLVDNVENFNSLVYYKYKKNYYVFKQAAIYGNPEILEWLCHNYFCWDEKTFIAAIRVKNWENMQWFLEKGFPKSPEAFNIAILFEDWQLLDWLIKNNFPKDESNFKVAMQTENIEIFDFLKEHGFRFDGETFSEAYILDNNIGMQWLKDNGCENNIDMVEYNLKHKINEGKEWVFSVLGLKRKR